MNSSINGTQNDGSDQSNAAKRGLESHGSAKKGDRVKRLRVSRACDQCRAGREKCDGAQPICQTCEAQSRSCSYNEQPKKRGIQPNYIRTLELILEWFLQQYPEGEKALSQRLPDFTDSVHQLIAFKDIAAAEALHQDWRSGIICRQIDQLLSASDIEQPTNSASNAISSKSSVKLGSRSAAQVDRATVPEDNDQRNNLDVERPQSCDDEILKLPGNAWNLLEHYFAFTQTFLPMTEKHDLLKLMYSYPTSGLSKADANAPEHAELWSIMAWSSLRVQPADDDHELLEKTARALIPLSGPFEVSHAKAFLVLSLIEMAKQSWISAWLTLGSAIRVLTHLIAGTPVELIPTSGRMRHTLLAAFLLETTVSAQIGTLAHLPATLVQILGLPIEDGIEEWSPWSDPAGASNVTVAKSPSRSISTFNELVRIALRFRSSDQGDKSDFDVMLRLLQNAISSSGRDNPSTILLKAGPSEAQERASAKTGSNASALSPANVHIRTGSNPNAWYARTGSDATPQAQPGRVIGIPRDNTVSVSGDTSVQGAGSAKTPNVWLDSDPSLGAGNIFNFDYNTGNTGTGADIFEELAMLDPTEENPKFMQNLGFGPDLDLAEFFGDDYQPSDPLLMYTQSTPHTSFLETHEQSFG